MIWVFLISNAQHRIAGRITDQDHAPLAGATVFIYDLGKGTISDLNGYYEITNLPAGIVKIHFSFIGYSNHIETVVLQGELTELNISLRQTAVEAEEIVVSSGYHATQHENAVKIDVLKVNPHTLKSTPNFMETITRVPGVNMISKGSGVSKPVIRGLSMNDVLVLNNGVRFENYQYSSHHPLGIDEFGIEDVEIIKGPASLLFGADAIGGVLNFIKEKPAPVGSIAGDFNMHLYSNSLGMTTNFGVKGASRKFFAGLRAGRKTNADFLQGGGAFVPNSRFNEISVKTNAGFTGKIGVLNLFYDYNNQKLGLTEDEAIEEITQRGRNNEIFFQELSTHLLSSQNKLFLDRFKLDLNSAYQRTELIHFGEEDTYEIQMRLATITYETKLHLPSDRKSEYILGFQGFYQINTNVNDRETILLPDANTSSYGAFGLLQHIFFNKLRLQTGFRYDWKLISSQAVGLISDTLSYRAPVDKTFGSFSGSLGAVFHVTQELLIRANAATAYRTPNLAELTSNGQHELRYEIGDPDLVPVKGFETDLSLHLHKDNLTFDLAGFYNILNHYIYIAPTGDTVSSGMPVYRYQQADAFLYGGEAGLHFHPKKVNWLHVETTFSSVIGKKNHGEYLPFVPAHKFSMEFRVEKEKAFFLHRAFAAAHALTAFEQNKVAPDETPTSGYTLLDLSIGGDIKLNHHFISVSLHINNIFDRKYIDHLSTLKEVNFYDPGRNISVNLKFPFGSNT
jgi:iron complex outermembrane receptor protein